ncbi:hypothetical protein [Halomicrobium salinisoli]|uniref:hypothetical protein n=1 Tax=Halomicrobium salinisoli TaxID=2878391 RepID=UPI001CF00D27|nr:hypothetical protein [Halomicrobium salinisoli]
MTSGDRELLVHLGGYASIAAVLATANWASLGAVLLAAPIVLAALYLGGQMLIRRLTARARRDLEDDPATPGAARADGGHTSTHERRDYTHDSDSTGTEPRSSRRNQ